LPKSPRLDGLARVTAAIFDQIDLSADTARSAVETLFNHAQEATWTLPRQTAHA
jgi:hypothetical protein